MAGSSAYLLEKKLVTHPSANPAEQGLTLWWLNRETIPSLW